MPFVFFSLEKLKICWEFFTNESPLKYVSNVNVPWKIRHINDSRLTNLSRRYIVRILALNIFLFKDKLYIFKFITLAEATNAVAFISSSAFSRRSNYRTSKRSCTCSRIFRWNNARIHLNLIRKWRNEDIAIKNSKRIYYIVSRVYLIYDNKQYGTTRNGIDTNWVVHFRRCFLIFCFSSQKFFPSIFTLFPESRKIRTCNFNTHIVEL